MNPSGETGPTLSGAARAAVGVVAQTLAPIPHWTHGEFVGIETAPGATLRAPADEEEPHYDEEEDAWIFGSTFVFGAHPSVTTEEYQYRIRYLRNRVAQPDFATADAMEAHVTILFSGKSEPSEVVVGFEYDYAYVIDVNVPELGLLPLAIDAAGTMRGCNVSITSTGVESGYYAMTFAGPLTMDESGCALGTLPITFTASGEGSCQGGIPAGEGQVYQMAASFGGNGQVSWTVAFEGHTVASGTEPAPCGGAGPTEGRLAR